MSRAGRLLDYYLLSNALESAGPAALKPLRVSVGAAVSGAIGRGVIGAVYVAVDRGSRVRYVGSFFRSEGDGFTARMREHSRAGRVREWTDVVLVPIEGVSPDAVRLAEGRVGRLLMPAENRRLPRPSRYLSARTG